METYFDNKGNILNANIRINRDQSIVYSLKTTFGLRGRKITVLKDENPLPGKSATVGLIHWKEKALEISGLRKGVNDLRRTEGGLFKKFHHWRWANDRKEYELRHDNEGWKATLDNNMSIAARFLIESRPHLFTKADAPSLHLTKTALEADEVFLILALIYSEIKRQDKTNSSSSNSGVGW